MELNFFDFTKEPGKIKNKKTIVNNVKPLITIITPYYNGSEYINQTANSIFNQTFPYWEWIIVNDGSTQTNTKDILDKLVKEDSRIKVYNKENEGVCKARDYAISKANTDLIFVLDSDDLIENTVLECSYWSLKTNPGASWVYCNSVGFDDMQYLWNKRFNSETEKKENLLTVCSLIKKDVIEQVGGYSFVGDNVHEDWHLWLRILAKGYYPVKMNYYGFWYRRKKTDSRMNSINNDKQKSKTAKKIIDNQAQKITKFIKAVQYPVSDDYKFDSIPKEFDFDKKSINIKGEKERILFIFPWCVIGGVDKFSLDLISKLDKNKYDITIITTEPSEYVWRQKFEEYADEYFDLTTFLHRENWPGFIHYLIKTRNIDLVFFENSFYGYYILPWLKYKFPEIPFVDYVHMEEMHWRNGGYPRDSISVSKFLDKTFTCTKHLKDFMFEEMGREEKNVDVAYIGVDDKKFDPDLVDLNEYPEILKYADKKILLFVCRMVEQKRPILMMKIMISLLKIRKDIVLFAVGDGPMLDWMKEIAKTNGIEENIIFWGAHSDPKPFYKAADITMIPSLIEGLTITSYESLSMGTPVITADVGGQKELVGNDCGRVIKCYQNKETDLCNFDYSKQEIDDYVDAVIDVLNPDNYSRIQEKCREKIQKGFSTDLVVNQISQVFDDLIKSGSRVNPELCRNKELAENYLVLFNEMNRKYFEFPEDFIGMNKKNKPPKEEITLKEKLWSNPLYRGNIRILQKLGVIKFLKKHDVDKKMKKIYKKINN